MSAPKVIYADRGPQGGWIYREEKMTDTEHEYIRSDLVESLKTLIELQAEDEGLWCQAHFASEDYIQRALREVHNKCELLFVRSETDES